MPAPTKMTPEQWRAEGVKRFGEDESQWKFKCPWCEHVATPDDWKNAGAPPGAVAFSCVGRWTGVKPEANVKKGEGPCHYSGGGLMQQNPIEINGQRIFDFAAK